MIDLHERVRVLVLLAGLSCVVAYGADEELAKRPPGRYFGLAAAHSGAPSFKEGRPIVGTSYFYWYDIDSKSHIIDGDGSDALTTHPADMNDISYKRRSWHKTQLVDMIDAGVDFLMPVFWGVPGRYDGWSFAGLGPLVEAHSELEAKGAEPPKIGLFYDTSILKWNDFRRAGRGNYPVDLRTEFGKAWFYTAMRDFFSLIPPGKWARVDGRPIVFLYSAGFARGQDEGQFEYVRKRFAEDFAVEPFIVKSGGWKSLALGPGYDHSAVPGRSPLIVERRDGKTYIDRWRKVLGLNPAHRPWMVHVETWNEWHEGTDVAHSREYGRLYIELTKLFADLWHQRAHLKGDSDFEGKKTISWEPGHDAGINVRASSGDGVWKASKVGGTEAITAAPNPELQGGGRYLYFNIDDAFAFDLYEQTTVVTVTYHDSGCSSFRPEYDSSNPDEGVFDGAFRSVPDVKVEGGGEWKTARFVLPECRFMNRCNGVDFRLAIIGGDLELSVSKVRLERREVRL